MNDNEYLNQVLQKQEEVEGALKRKRSARRQNLNMNMPAQAMGGAVQQAALAPTPDFFDHDEAGGGSGIDVRITGWWMWKTVVVPPNVYVVHTRRGHAEPLTVGLGTSFRFNPYTDAFLVVPAAVQTILINANCICTERQGILVQAYVQWIVEDIETAYRRLDFSDPDDPMNLVNVQLREQAEAAIKDKVSTMSIDEVLADKQPIIEELTSRLRVVAEGRGGEDEGLGLKIVTVHIKEAVVSSTRLWENLQRPFRAEREKLARMAELSAQREIAQRELEIRQERETREMGVEAGLAEQRATEDRKKFDRNYAENTRRHALEQEQQQKAIAEKAETDKRRKEAEIELERRELELAAERVEAEIARVEAQARLDAAEAAKARAAAEHEQALADLVHASWATREERQLAIERTRRAIDNDLSDALVRARLIDKLPELAERMPAPEHLRQVNINGDGGGGGVGPLMGLVAGAMDLLETRREAAE